MFLEWVSNSGKLQIISGKFQNNAISGVTKKFDKGPSRKIMIVPKLITTDYLVPKTFQRYCIVILTFWTGINNNNMGTEKRVYLKLRFTSTYSSKDFKTIYFVVMVTSRGVFKALPNTWEGALREKDPNTEFFLVCIFPYSVEMLENADQKKFRIWTPFSQWSFMRYLHAVTYFPKKLHLTF